MPHRIDPMTQYCMRCGAAETEIFDQGARQHCQDETSTVVGISHIIVGKRLEELTERIFAKPSSA